MQHRLDRVLSLTTSLVTPLNLVIVGVDSGCIKSLVDDDKNDISVDGPMLLRANVEPVLHMLFVAVVIDGGAISEPFSDTALLRDCARCFFKLANVVPACDWSILWVSVCMQFEFLIVCVCVFVCVFYSFVRRQIWAKNIFTTITWKQPHNRRSDGCWFNLPSACIILV